MASKNIGPEWQVIRMLHSKPLQKKVPGSCYFQNLFRTHSSSGHFRTIEHPYLFTFRTYVRTFYLEKYLFERMTKIVHGTISRTIDKNFFARALHRINIIQNFYIELSAK